MNTPSAGTPRTTLMVITGAGSVGIGTTTPQKPLDVTASGGIQVSQTAEASSQNELFFADNGQIRSHDDNHRIIFNRAGNQLELREYGTIIFSSNATSGQLTNSVFIDTNGNVGIGLGTGTTSAAQKLDVAGSILYTGSLSQSDQRFKTNVVPLTGVLERIERIRGVSFDWNELYKSMGRATDRRELGLLAQEVEAVFPELVTTWGEDNYRALDYGRLTAVLVEAIKELNAKLKSVTEKLDTSESPALKKKAKSKAQSEDV